MNDSKLFHIFKVIRSFLFSSVNKEFLIFLFFFNIKRYILVVDDLE